jgi:hypothetical protein
MSDKALGNKKEKVVRRVIATYEGTGTEARFICIWHRHGKSRECHHKRKREVK